MTVQGEGSASYRGGRVLSPSSCQKYLGEREGLAPRLSARSGCRGSDLEVRYDLLLAAHNAGQDNRVAADRRAEALFGNSFD